MDHVILKSIPLQLQMEDLIKELRIKPNSPYANQLKGLVEEATAIARPKAMYKKASLESQGDDYVIVSGIKLSSRIVRINLAGISEFFPAVVTCGRELEEWANSFTDMLENFWATTLCEMALYVAIRTMEERLKEQFNLKAIAKMNPGSVVDWPINEQRNLFDIIGNTKNLIGVELTDTFLMLPIKSVSGIWFPAENYENCMLCSKDCPRRKASYDPHMYHDKYKPRNCS